MTTIELTEHESEYFRLFQEHRDIFQIFVEAGVFDQRSSSVTLSFDHKGVLQTIKRADLLFTRKFDLHQD